MNTRRRYPGQIASKSRGPHFAAVRAQPADFHMDGVAKLRQGLRVPAAHVPPESLVFGHFPLDWQRALQWGDATGIGLRRTRDGSVEQAGPQHESVGSGPAARHAKREQVALAQCGRSCPAGQVRGEAGGCRQMQKGSSLRAWTVGSGDRGRLKVRSCRTSAAPWPRMKDEADRPVEAKFTVDYGFHR